MISSLHNSARCVPEGVQGHRDLLPVELSTEDEEVWLHLCLPVACPTVPLQSALSSLPSQVEMHTQMVRVSSADDIAEPSAVPSDFLVWLSHLAHGILHDLCVHPPRLKFESCHPPLFVSSLVFRVHLF